MFFALGPAGSSCLTEHTNSTNMLFYASEQQCAQVIYTQTSVDWCAGRCMAVEGPEDVDARGQMSCVPLQSTRCRESFCLPAERHCHVVRNGTAGTVEAFCAERERAGRQFECKRKRLCNNNHKGTQTHTHTLCVSTHESSHEVKLHRRKKKKQKNGTLSHRRRRRYRSVRFSQDLSVASARSFLVSQGHFSVKQQRKGRSSVLQL